jgi:hypothetical protein
MIDDMKSSRQTGCPNRDFVIVRRPSAQTGVSLRPHGDIRSVVMIIYHASCPIHTASYGKVSG